MISGQPGAANPHEAYYFYWDRELQAVRSGKWKLYFAHKYRTLAGKPGGSDGKPVPYSQAETGVALFDLEKDMGETTNVAAQHPDVVERLKSLAEKAPRGAGRLGDQTGGQRHPSTGARGVATMVTRSGGVPVGKAKASQRPVPCFSRTPGRLRPWHLTFQGREKHETRAVTTPSIYPLSGSGSVELPVLRMLSRPSKGRWELRSFRGHESMAHLRHSTSPAPSSSCRRTRRTSAGSRPGASGRRTRIRWTGSPCSPGVSARRACP